MSKNMIPLKMETLSPPIVQGRTYTHFHLSAWLHFHSKCRRSAPAELLKRNGSDYASMTRPSTVIMSPNGRRTQYPLNFTTWHSLLYRLLQIFSFFLKLHFSKILHYILYITKCKGEVTRKVVRGEFDKVKKLYTTPHILRILVEVQPSSLVSNTVQYLIARYRGNINNYRVVLWSVAPDTPRGNAVRAGNRQFRACVTNYVRT